MRPACGLRMGGNPPSARASKETAGANVQRAATMPLSEDAVLVARAKRRDAAAAAALVLRYQDRVYNAMCRMCRNPDDALDLTQSAFVKALQNLPRFEGRAGFYTWLFRIAMNLAISHRRRERRPTPSFGHLDEMDAGPPQPHSTQESDPASITERVELHRRLECALAELDEEFRAAVILKDVEELDYATIAEILDVPIGTVKSRIHRGRMLLRQALEMENRCRDAG